MTFNNIVKCLYNIFWCCLLFDGECDGQRIKNDLQKFKIIVEKFIAGLLRGELKTAMVVVQDDNCECHSSYHYSYSEEY